MTSTNYIDVTHLEDLEDGMNKKESTSGDTNFGSGSEDIDDNDRGFSFPIPIDAELASAVYMAMAMDDANFDGVKHHPSNRIQHLKITLTSVVGAMALSSMFLSLLAMIIESGSALVYLCFGLTAFIVAPAVIVQKSRLQWEPTFREVSNDLRMKVNDFAMANSTLHNEVGRLERQVIRLSAVEERFNQIVGREQIDIDRARKLVRKNGQIQKEMKKLQAASEMQAIIEAIMLADKDSNYHISEKELDEMMLRLRVFANRSSSISEDEIRAAFKNSMTNHGASLGRIHSHLQAQQREDGEENDVPKGDPEQAPGHD